jgi:hypothetical protein
MHPSASRFTPGSSERAVGIDARGRVVVTDFQAAAAEWKGSHAPRIDEMIRRERAEPEDFFADLSKQDLLERWVAYDLLASLLVRVAIHGVDGDQEATARAYIERTTAQLREAATQRDADVVISTHAETLLRELVRETLHDPGETT